MKEFHTSVDIQASPLRVWAVLCDVERWPEWTASIRSVQRLDSGPFAMGSRARVIQPKLRPAVWQVTELDEGRSFVWESRSPGLRIIAGHVVEPYAAGTRVTLSVEFSGLLGPLMGSLTRGLTEQYVPMEAQGLKMRSEQPAA